MKLRYLVNSWQQIHAKNSQNALDNEDTSGGDFTWEEDAWSNTMKLKLSERRNSHLFEKPFSDHRATVLRSVPWYSCPKLIFVLIL